VSKGILPRVLAPPVRTAHSSEVIKSVWVRDATLEHDRSALMRSVRAMTTFDL
jgi:hypothetical protein